MPGAFQTDPPTPLVGSLRDGVATTNALLLLLRSRNVAPKAIAQLLPALRDTFGNTNAEFAELRASLSEPPPVSLEGLGWLLSQQVATFDAAIAQGSQSAITARTRLSLEQTISGVCHELSAILALVELWSDTLLPKTNVDLVELLTLSRTGDQPLIPHSQSLRVQLVAQSPELLLCAPPRAILNLLGLIAAVVADRTKQDQLSLRLASSPDNEHLLEVSSDDLSARRYLTLQLPALLPETANNVIDAAGCLGLKGVCSDTSFRFCWSPPRP